MAIHPPSDTDWAGEVTSESLWRVPNPYYTTSFKCDLSFPASCSGLPALGCSAIAPLGTPKGAQSSQRASQKVPNVVPKIYIQIYPDDLMLLLLSGINELPCFSCLRSAAALCSLPEN